jgi:cytochrome c oxidase subunit 4
MSSEAMAGEFGQAQGGATSPGHGAGSDHGAHGGHASPGFYWAIGGVLTVITAVEVAVFYIPFLASVLVPILLILSAAKFVLVVMFFMHLKYDSRIFSGVFLAGLVLAAFMTVALIILYQVLPNYDLMG